MRRHAHDVGGTALERPVERPHARGRIVHHQLEARRHHLLDGHGADVVAHGREAEQHRRVIVPPVGDHGAAVGEQRVVRVHDALRHARRAGSEGEIGDLVGIVDGGDLAGRARRGERTAAHVEHRLHRGKRDARRTVARLHHQRRGARALEELHDLGGGVVLVQRGHAHVAVACAGEQRYHALGARGQPHADALAAAHARGVPGLRQRVHPGEELLPGQACPPIAQRVTLRSFGCVLLEQRVEGVPAPGARGVMARRLLRVEKRENRIHGASGRTSPGRACAWRGTLRRARAIPRSRGTRAAAGRAPRAPVPRRRRGAH